MWPNTNLAVTSICYSSVFRAVTNPWYDLSFSVYSIEHVARTILSSVPCMYRWCIWKALRGNLISERDD
jgi:hypothetical protein